MSWPRLALGCGNFGGIGSAPAFFGKGSNEEEARAIMDAGLGRRASAGSTPPTPTAAAAASRIIGRWRADRRPDGLLVTTKVFNPVTRRPGRPRPRARPDQARTSRAASSGSASTGSTSTSPTTRTRRRRSPTRSATFEELVAEGDDRRLGAQQLRRGRDRGGARATAGRRSSRTRTRCSTASDEADVLPLCAEHGIAYVPFGPLAGGWLAGQVRARRRASRRARG